MRDWARVIGGVLTALLLGCGTPLAAADEVSALPLEQVGGGVVRLADWRGKVVLVNFWATWCPPCRDEIPDLVQAQRELGERGLQVVGVNFMDSAEAAALQAFARRYGVNYPLVTLPPRQMMALAQGLGGVMGLPTTLVLDRQGEVVKRHVGQITLEQIRNLTQPLLEP